MRSKYLYILFCLFLLSVTSPNSFAKEKLVYYEAGAFTVKKKEFIHLFRYESNSRYKIIFGFVNYSPVTGKVSFRSGRGRFKNITLKSHHSRKEVIEFSPLREGKFLIHLKADFNDPNFKFASFDIIIIQEE